MNREQRSGGEEVRGEARKFLRFGKISQKETMKREDFSPLPETTMDDRRVANCLLTKRWL